MADQGNDGGYWINKGTGGLNGPWTAPTEDEIDDCLGQLDLGQWKICLELGAEEGLRKVGFPEIAVDEILSRDTVLGQRFHRAWNLATWKGADFDSREDLERAYDFDGQESDTSSDRASDEFVTNQDVDFFRLELDTSSDDDCFFSRKLASYCTERTPVPERGSDLSASDDDFYGQESVNDEGFDLDATSDDEFDGEESVTSLHREIGDQSMSRHEATALCANLSSTTKMNALKLHDQKFFGTREGCSLLGEALVTNSSLTRLELKKVQMGGEAVRCLMNCLSVNKTLVVLDLHGNPLMDEGVAAIGEYLRTSSTLESLDLTDICSGYEGAKQMSFALATNTTLKSFWFGNNNMGKDGMKKLLEPLSRYPRDIQTSSDSHTNTTVEFLGLNDTSIHNFHMESLEQMIRTNKVLTGLDISRAPLLSEDWIHKLFPALGDNASLKRLYAYGNTELTGTDVKDALFKLIEDSNTNLEVFEMSKTDMEIWMGRLNEEMRRNREYKTMLRDESKVQCTSGRLVLCGREYAGKTAICNSMDQILKGTPWSHHFNMWWKTLMRLSPSLRKLLFGSDAHKELPLRTRGFDVLVLSDDPYKTSVWTSPGTESIMPCMTTCFLMFKTHAFYMFLAVDFHQMMVILKGQ
ncbi:unnamed protein product [Calypogeia fissa]